MVPDLVSGTKLALIAYRTRRRLRHRHATMQWPTATITSLTVARHLSRGRRNRRLGFDASHRRCWLGCDGNSGTRDTDGISYGKNEHKMGWNAQPAPLPLTMFGAEKRLAKKASSPSPWTAWMAEEHRHLQRAQRRRLWKMPPPMCRDAINSDGHRRLPTTQFTLSDGLPSWSLHDR